MEGVINAGVINITLSDHFMPYIAIKKKQVTYGTTSFKCRQLKDFTPEMLFEDLNNEDWTEFYNAVNTTECWEVMYKIFFKVLDRICPEKNYKNVKKHVVNRSRRNC